MKLELFDNNLGFKPSSDTLNWWAFLPQVSSDKKSPSIFGTLKSMTIPNIMVMLLIILEIGSLYILQEEGAIPLGLIALMIIDFIIALIPLIKPLTNLIPSIVTNNIFIRQIKLKNNFVDENETKENYQSRLRSEIKNERKKESKIFWISFITTILIVLSAFGKLYLIYDTFGEDMFSITSGRVTFALVIISVYIHLAYTTNVIGNIIFKRKIKNELHEFDSIRNHKHSGDYTKSPVYFDGKYSYQKAGNQILGRIISLKDVETMEPSEVAAVTDNSETIYFSKKTSESKKDVFLCHMGVLTDPEIFNILSVQSNYKENILAIAREIQIETTK